MNPNVDVNLVSRLRVGTRKSLESNMALVSRRSELSLRYSRAELVRVPKIKTHDNHKRTSGNFNRIGCYTVARGLNLIFLSSKPNT